MSIPMPKRLAEAVRERCTTAIVNGADVFAPGALPIDDDYVPIVAIGGDGVIDPKVGEQIGIAHALETWLRACADDHFAGPETSAPPGVFDDGATLLLHVSRLLFVRVDNVIHATTPRYRLSLAGGATAATYLSDQGDLPRAAIRRAAEQLRDSMRAVLGLSTDPAPLDACDDAWRTFLGPSPDMPPLPDSPSS